MIGDGAPKVRMTKSRWSTDSLKNNPCQNHNTEKVGDFKILLTFTIIWVIMKKSQLKSELPIFLRVLWWCWYRKPLEHVNCSCGTVFSAWVCNVECWHGELSALSNTRQPFCFGDLSAVFAWHFAYFCSILPARTGSQRRLDLVQRRAPLECPYSWNDPEQRCQLR